MIPAPKKAVRLNSAGGPGRTSASAGGAKTSANPLCNTLEPEALQLTNTAFLSGSKPQAQTCWTVTARR